MTNGKLEWLGLMELTGVLETNVQFKVSCAHCHGWLTIYRDAESKMLVGWMCHACGRGSRFSCTETVSPVCIVTFPQLG